MAQLEVTIRSEAADERFSRDFVDSLIEEIGRIKQAAEYDHLAFRLTGIDWPMRPGSFAHLAHALMQELAGWTRPDFLVHLNPAQVTLDWIRALAQVDALVVVECDLAFRDRSSGRFDDAARQGIGHLMRACAHDLIAPPLARWTLGCGAPTAFHHWVHDLKFTCLDPIFPDSRDAVQDKSRLAAVHEEVRALLEWHASTAHPRLAIGFIDAFLIDLLDHERAPQARTAPALHHIGGYAANPSRLDAACADCAWAGHCRGSMSVDAHARGRLPAMRGALKQSVFCHILDSAYTQLTGQLVSSGHNPSGILGALAALRAGLQG